MENGKWIVESGEWRVESGEWGSRFEIRDWRLGGWAAAPCTTLLPLRGSSAEGGEGASLDTRKRAWPERATRSAQTGWSSGAAGEGASLDTRKRAWPERATRSAQTDKGLRRRLGDPRNHCLLLTCSPAHLLSCSPALAEGALLTSLVRSASAKPKPPKADPGAGCRSTCRDASRGRPIRRPASRPGRGRVGVRAFDRRPRS